MPKKCAKLLSKQKFEESKIYLFIFIYICLHLFCLPHNVLFDSFDVFSVNFQWGKFKKRKNIERKVVSKLLTVQLMIFVVVFVVCVNLLFLIKKTGVRPFMCSYETYFWGVALTLNAHADWSKLPDAHLKKASNWPVSSPVSYMGGTTRGPGWHGSGRTLCTELSTQGCSNVHQCGDNICCFGHIYI